MANSVFWFKQSTTAFYVSITGFLGSAGEVWGGTSTSPNGRWRVAYPKTSVQQNIAGGFKHNFSGSVTGKQLTGGSLTYQTGGGATGAFDNLPWGTRTGEIWSFQSGGQPVNNWEGNAYLTLFNAADLNNFATWRFNVDIEIHKTS